MRAAEREAARLTRSARRDRVRRAAAPGLPAAPPTGLVPQTEPATATASMADPVLDTETLRPFDDIEQW